MPQTSTAGDPSPQNLRHVSRTRLFISSLGITFFSVLSILVAFYAFIELPQVQDLLLDARPYWVQEAVYWAWFYAVGIFVWAIPLVFTARLLLLQNFDAIGIDTEERFKFYIFRLPSFYVVLAFAAVFLGVIASADNLPLPSGGNKYEAAIRKLVEGHLITLFIASGAVLVLVLIRDLFIGGYGRLMERMEQRDPETFRRTLVRIERLTRRPSLRLDGLDLHLTALKPDFLPMETWIASQRVKVYMWRYMSRLTWLLLALVAVHFLSYSDFIQSQLTIPHSFSNSSLESVLEFLADTVYLKRASFLFVVFGAWLPFLTILALLSNRFQFPFIATLVAVTAGLTLFVGDGHDVRIARISTEEQASLKPPSFAGAIKDWKAASGWDAKGCEQLAPGAAEFPSCPRPIIVAGEGGGSRAAFLLASVLGALEDESLDKNNNPQARPFHNQLFAISSVSGSSAGAALFVSALKVQAQVPVEDLKKALFRQRLWFPNIATAKPAVTAAAGLSPEGTKTPFLTDFVTYKDALQAILSNDFISPTIIGYLARDSLMLSRFPFVMDRAGILETAWEDAFGDVYGASQTSSPLAGPLQAMAPRSGSWVPLVFFNATSIETGRRIIVTPVKISEPIAGSDALFADAYDLHELLCSPYPDPNTKAYPALTTLDSIARVIPSFFSPVAHAKCESRKPISIDVRVSTAAGVSSRSPFVSPHANVRDRRAQIVDGAVDGGFFDNSGIVTALEIANALKAVDPKLMPFIVQVSSEPDWFKDAKNCLMDGEYQDRPQIPDQADFRPIGSLTDLLTVNSTRIARGYETILELPGQAARLNGGARSVAQIYICPQPQESFLWETFLKLTKTPEEPAERSLRIRRKIQKQTQYKSVSLSWWLSPPLQAYLDGQIYAEHNVRERNCVISLLKDRQPGDASVCP